ncbi:hypothetical protein RvY_10194-2 [Ramazzottius varieornatus]|uniref:C2H2-type domain-containing protein n=1 Tax=Ramazzottius varieornatus TaxID=947166 RepID=A0A1D1VEE2_RAMVA|nr:hypothetical protein RvY_10194-2 [Ramazzottius varieornatus]
MLSILDHFAGSLFTSPSTLSRHKDVHSTTRRFVCSLCGKGYKQLAGLRAHQTVHTGNGHKCQICSKEFRQDTNLRIHMNAHRNIRPYGCFKCSKCFTQSSNLRSHVSAVHRSCYRCWTEIMPKDDLKTHIKACKTACGVEPSRSTEIAELDTQLVSRLPSRLSRSVANKVSGLKSVLVLSQTGLRVSMSGNRKCRLPYERKIRTYSVAEARK